MSRRIAAGLAAFLVLTATSPAAAYRDCGSYRGGWLIRVTPNELRGVTLGPESWAVSDWLLDLGLTDRAIRVGDSPRLTATRLTWSAETPSEALGIAAVGFRPDLAPIGHMRGFHLEARPPAPVTESHARDVTRVIAVVPDLDAELERLGTAKVWSVAGGASFGIPELDAIAVDVPLAWGSIRLLQPTDPNGIAGRALAARGRHWWGFAVDVDDVRTARRRLEARGFITIERIERGDAVVTVRSPDPSLPAVELVRRSGTPRF